MGANGVRGDLGSTPFRSGPCRNRHKTTRPRFRVKSSPSKAQASRDKCSNRRARWLSLPPRQLPASACGTGPRSKPSSGFLHQSFPRSTGEPSQRRPGTALTGTAPVFYARARQGCGGIGPYQRLGAARACADGDFCNRFQQNLAHAFGQASKVYSRQSSDAFGLAINHTCAHMNLA